MRTRLICHIAVCLGLIAPATIRAQATAKTLQIPAAYRPPPGMCRVWVEGVPPAKQPAVTDCQRALRNLPANAQVVFGEAKPAANETRQASAPRPAARDTSKAKRDTAPKKPIKPPPSR